MPSGRKSLIEFIDKYRDLECLWKVTDKYYKNKQKRLNAMEKLLQIWRKTEPNANIDTITKKINSLRSSFNKEHNKVKASYRSGADDVHIPKLWYYDLLLFLADKDTETRQQSNIESVLNKTTTENEDTADFSEMDLPSSCSSQSSFYTNVSNFSGRSISQRLLQQNNYNSKRKLKKSATEVLAKISNRLDNPKSKPKYSAFGEHVAEKLRSMPEEMALYCQKIINDAIFHADCNNLGYSSRIINEYEHLHCQQPPAPLPHAQQSQTQLPPAELNKLFNKYIDALRNK